MLDEISIIISKKRVKNLNLRIDRHGIVKLSVPNWCTQKKVNEFLNAKEEWIKTHVARIQAQASLTQQTTEKQKNSPNLESYRKQMQAVVPDLIKKWEPVMGVQVNAYRFRPMTSRWGSCNTREKRICLNLHLMEKPLICLEYVLVHEMVHLLEASHNKRFHALMTQFMPDWKAYKRLLTKI